MPLVIPLIVFGAITIALAAIIWGWANGTLGETPQERIDQQFEDIVRRLSD